MNQAQFKARAIDLNRASESPRSLTWPRIRDGHGKFRKWVGLRHTSVLVGRRPGEFREEGVAARRAGTQGDAQKVGVQG